MWVWSAVITRAGSTAAHTLQLLPLHKRALPPTSVAMSVLGGRSMMG